MFRFLTAVAAVLPMALTMAAPARAQLEICNKTADEVAVAIAYDAQQDTISRGWFHLPGGGCTNVVTTPLDQSYYYYYAISKERGLQWTGAYRFCTGNDDSFQIKGTGDCESRGGRTTGFSQFPVQDHKAFTFNIRGAEPAAPAPADNATTVPATPGDGAMAPASPDPMTPDTTSTLPEAPATAPVVMPETAPDAAPASALPPLSGASPGMNTVTIPNAAASATVAPAPPSNQPVTPPEEPASRPAVQLPGM